MCNSGGIRWRIAALSALAFLAGACSADLSLNNVTLIPKPETVMRSPDWATFSGGKNGFGLRPITAADLIDSQGQCAAIKSEQTAQSGYPSAATSTPLVVGGISLQMTECDVVRRAGTAEKVDFGADGRGGRVVVLTYLKGPWPGVYRFAGGRLVSIERAPGPPPAPEKPEKGKKAPKKPTST